MKVFLVVLASLIAVESGMPGGWSPQDPADSQWWTMLSGLEAHNGLLNAENFNLKAVKSQVVSGANYRFTLEKNGKTCEIQMWVQAWLNKTEVTNDTCTELAKEKRRVDVLGGVQTIADLDKTDPIIKTCLGAMLDDINAQVNSAYRLVDSNIISATKQVVSGWMYGFKMEVAPSSCMMTAASKGLTSADCTVNSANTEGRETWSGRCWYKDWETPSTKILDLTPAVDVSLPETPNTKPSDQIDQNDSLLGGDTHDKVPHGGYNIGSGRPLQVSVVGVTDKASNLLGEKKLLGQDGHDLVNHAKKLLGGDGHDLIDHGKKLLGQDGHDLVNHLSDKVKNLIGGDDHDYKDHIQKLIGGDDHDLVDHIGKLIGGDDHDYKNHVQKLLGQDGHDFANHIGKLIGGDDHDYKEHIKKLLGGDGHDQQNHGQQMIGGDDHDFQDHGRKLLGGDDHDYVQHAIRQGKANATKPLIGGDDHDLCHVGMFREFQQKFQRQYQLGEEEKRFNIFCDNMRKARKLQETEKGSAIYGATKFADLTEQEFGQYVGKPWDLSANQRMRRADIPKGPVPEAFDWRDHGAVTPVKNQGSCGSCWAFSTTGNIEGQWAIKKGKLVSLSEQELVDCDKVDEGCNGGLPSNAYKEIERLGGLETESEYKYMGEDEKCAFKKSEVKVFINDSVSISSNETEMAAWLAQKGPISIGINAFAMQFYMGGISHPWKIFCNPKSLDHGVLIVGYGVQDGEPYWVVKNSWGPDWGEKGYYLVYRGSGVCGLNEMCTSAVVD